MQDTAAGSGKTNKENHQNDGSQIPSVYVPGGGAPPESETIKDKVEEDIEVLQVTSGGGKNDDNNQKDGSQIITGAQKLTFYFFPLVHFNFLFFTKVKYFPGWGLLFNGNVLA